MDGQRQTSDRENHLLLVKSLLPCVHIVTEPPQPVVQGVHMTVQDRALVFSQNYSFC